MGADPISITIAAVVAASTVNGIITQKGATEDAAKAQRKAASTAQNERMNRDLETKRQQLRQERVRRAQIQQSSQNTGVAASSGQIGAESAINTQVGQNISNITSEQQANLAIGYYQQKASDAQVRAQSGQQFTQLAMTGLSLYSGFGAAGAAAANPGIGTGSAGVAAGSMSPSTVSNPYALNLFQ